MSRELTDLLAEISPPGAFATRTTAAPDALRLEVRGVGRVALPVTRARARRLCGVARPARYGLEDRTLFDPGVRDTWEIARSRIKIDQRQWKQTLLPELERMRRGLGLPEECRLSAELHNMLVYEPGQFFLPHQDTEKQDDMIGSLVVLLPSDHKGGSIQVEHHDEKVSFRGSREKLTLIAFYADCRHEVRPVKEGYRVALTYNLRAEGGGAGISSPPAAEVTEPLVRAVGQYFEMPPPDPWRDLPCRVLVYLLDHQYTQRGLDWQRLKNADAARAAALQEAARQLDCEILLALAEVRETRSDEAEMYMYGDGWGYEEEEEDFDEEASSAAGLGDLIDTEIELRHWVGKGKPRGSRCVHEHEVFHTKPSAELRPFNSEHEPYMGNWGNTVDRWYRRGAVVLWPRRHGFALRAEASGPWAISEIAKKMKSGDLAGARSLTGEILPSWDNSAQREEGPRFYLDVLRLAGQLGKPDLASSLLQPFELERLTAEASPGLGALIDAYGLPWCRDLLARWASGDEFDQSLERPEWLAALPDLCRALCQQDSAAGRKLAAWLVGEQWPWWTARWKENCELPDPESSLAVQKADCEPFLGLLESSLITGSRDLHDTMLGFAADAAGGPVLAMTHLLRAAVKNRPRTTLAGLRLGDVHARCLKELQSRLEEPPRGENDWSIPAPIRCRCDLCEELSRFLADPERTLFEWPLAKQKRRHIHGIIEAHAFPVVHATRRTGRPYTLVLEKTQALFETEAAERRTWKRELSWLKKNQRPF